MRLFAFYLRYPPDGYYSGSTRSPTSPSTLCVAPISPRCRAYLLQRTPQTVVSSLYPFFFDAPGILILEWRFFALIAPIGFMGFIAQALLTMGLQREKAGRGTLAVCA